MKMRFTILVSTASVALASAAGDNLGLPEKYGSFSGKVQTVSMWRDYDRKDDSNYSHSLGLRLDYLSPEIAGLQAGFSYNGVGVLDSGKSAQPPGEELVLNGRVNVLNEAYLQYRFTALDAENTVLTVGRRMLEGEIFRHTEARQKCRSIEGIFLESADLPNTRFTIGHSWKLSNIYGFTANDGLSWDFDNYGDVFGQDHNSDGITFAEAVYTGIENLEAAFFNAYAWDAANLAGTRMKYALTEKTAVGGLYRSEKDTGRGRSHSSESYGLSIYQDVGSVALEGGYFGVSGDKLYFEENTTGINHPLGYSLILDADHFQGGADTLYLKAVTKLDSTVLYCLFNATWHSKADFDEQELDVVVKQPLSDALTLCLKGGIAWRDNDDGTNDTQTDGRIFMTYTF